MSLKIYNGFIMNKSFTAYELNVFVNNVVRKEMLKAYENIISKFTIGRTISIIDEYINFGKIDKEINKKNNILMESENIFYERKLFNNLKIACEIFIYPLENKTLFILNNDSQEYINAFSTIEGIEGYSFYDGIEEFISDEEYSQRNIDWRLATNNKYYLKDNALICDIINSFEFILPKKILSNINFESFLRNEHSRLTYLKEIGIKENYILLNINKNILNKSLFDIKKLI